MQLSTELYSYLFSESDYLLLVSNLKYIYLPICTGYAVAHPLGCNFYMKLIHYKVPLSIRIKLRILTHKCDKIGIT